MCKLINLIFLFWILKCKLANGFTEPRLIVLSFDGFRSDYINGNLTPTFYKFSKLGVWGKMKSTYPTKTFGNHFSIATGYYQETHGIVNNEMFDPVFNEVFNTTNENPKWWDNGLSVPIWIANEINNTNRRSGVMMWAGSNVPFLNRKPYYHQLYDKDLPWNKRINMMIRWMLDKNKPANLVMAYFEKPDKVAHLSGPFSSQTLAWVKKIDLMLYRFLEKLHSHNLHANIILLSDHGMCEVKVDHQIDLSNLTDTSLYKAFGSSPVLNILPNLGKQKEVYQMFKNLSKNYKFKVYMKKDIPNRFNYKNNPRILPILLEAEEGWDIFVKSWKKPNEIWGNHGYDNDLFSMRPFFMALGPNFKKKYIHKKYFTNVDLYPIMLKLLNLNQSLFPSNGTFSNVYEILR